MRLAGEGASLKHRTACGTMRYGRSLGTHDPLLGKQMLCQLSYSRMSAEDGTRTRNPLHGKEILYHCATSALVGTGGFEPPAFSLSERCSSQTEPRPQSLPRKDLNFDYRVQSAVCCHCTTGQGREDQI